MTKVIITGANSFIGTNFIKFSSFREIDQVSLLDTKPEKIDFDKYSVVMHLAAIVHQVKKIPETDYFKVNRDLCLEVAINAKKAGIKQFVFLSTLKVYGKSASDGNLVDENSHCFPEDFYGKSKLAAEIGLRKLESKDFIVSIIRPSLVYGEGVKANMLSLIKLVERYPVLPFGNINNRRNFLYIENLVGYIDRIIEKKASGTFIAIDGEAISTTELVKFISKYLEKKVILIKLPRIALLLLRYLLPGICERLFGSLEFDNTETLKKLNYSVPFTTSEGIRRTLISYRSRTR